MGIIFDTLESLGVAKKTTQRLFSRGTRDNPNINVWQDSDSGVIYIDDYYCGEEHYRDGQYSVENIRGSYDRMIDVRRRLQAYESHYVGRSICDFGCGLGDFLYAASPVCSQALGVELQQECLEAMAARDIQCASSLNGCDDVFDSVFCFHTIEHFDDPLAVLHEIKRSLKTGGRIIAEVPHANDFLLSMLKCQEFKNFTLWSPHLILHTRQSLTRLFDVSGFSVLAVEGVQRYPLANHFGWLKDGQPGGHKGELSMISSASLDNAYHDMLCRIDATDTLVIQAIKTD